MMRLTPNTQCPWGAMGWGAASPIHPAQGSQHPRDSVPGSFPQVPIPSGRLGQSLWVAAHTWAATIPSGVGPGWTLHPARVNVGGVQTLLSSAIYQHSERWIITAYAVPMWLLIILPLYFIYHGAACLRGKVPSLGGCVVR